MTEEKKLEIKEEKCNCICHSKWFRKFLTIALGSFVGVFCALSLFAALHRPPMPPCPYHRPMMRPPFAMQYHFRGPRGDFQKQMIQHRWDKKVPLENRAERPER